jgi:hypothetical protein
MKNIDYSFFDIIGKTPDVCHEKFGFPGYWDFSFIGFVEKGFHIKIGFLDKKAVEISLRRVNRDSFGIPKKLTDHEIYTIMKSNGGKIEWTLLSNTLDIKIWLTDDEKLLSTYDKIKNVLRLTADEFVIHKIKSLNAGFTEDVFFDS